MVKQLIGLRADVNAPTVKSDWSWRPNPKIALREAVEKGTKRFFWTCSFRLGRSIRRGGAEPNVLVEVDFLPFHQYILGIQMSVHYYPV